MTALNAGKHVYLEKPLGVTRAEGKRILEVAAENGLKVGGAPDTFLGAGLQTCRKLIDDGAIGRPVSATAFMTCHGHESWHPDPEFYYQAGGGPMLDMGPYYLTALVSLIGPVKRIGGMTSKAFTERTIGSEPKRGTTFPVQVPTHVAGLMEFENGAVGTILTSFDIWSANLPIIEIYGTEGTLAVPDPNGFGGAVRLWRGKGSGGVGESRGTGEWEDVPLTHGYAENSRGLGVADLASAVDKRRPIRASGELCYHVLDLMQGFHDSSLTGQLISITSGVERPAPMPTGLGSWEID